MPRRIPAFVPALALCLAAPLAAQSPSIPQEKPMSHHIRGPFDVKLVPQADPDAGAIGRLSIDKQFHGALEAGSKGQMLGFQNAAKDAGGYVALELVSGSLEGRQGSFVLQHNSTMEQGQGQQSIRVAPGSGTGELAGLQGSMVIDIVEGKHFYDFTYTLPSQP